MIHPKMTVIKERRKSLGLTQGDLASIAGISKSALAQLECGMRSNPAYDTVDALERALNRIEAKQQRRRSH